MKAKFIWGTSLLALAAGVGAYFAPSSFWQPLLINVATTFLAVAVGIVIVNIYLDKASRRGAVMSLLQLSDAAIIDFHDHVLDLVWTKFGKDEWGELVDGYVASGGDAMTIKPGFRRWIYDLVNADQSKLGPLIQSLDSSLQEIISLVGWSLDADLLACALRARNAIRLYRGIPFDDTDEACAKTTEHLIDIFLQSQFARRRLMEISELDDE
jgi:hypothetical protein